MSTPQQYSPKKLYRGNTYGPQQFTVSLKGANEGDPSTPLDLTGHTIEATWRFKYPTGEHTKTITSSDGGITITDPTNGVFVLNTFDLNWKAGRHYYDIDFIGPSGRKTYIKGVFDIEQNVDGL